MAKLKTLTDINGNKIYPQTSAAAVYMADGRTVEMAIESGGSGEAAYDDLPVGSIVSSVLPITDSRFLECRGQVISTHDYPELANILPWAFNDEPVFSTTIGNFSNMLGGFTSLVMGETILAFQSNGIMKFTGEENYLSLYRSLDKGKTWAPINLLNLYDSTSTGKVEATVNNKYITIRSSSSNSYYYANTTAIYSLDGNNFHSVTLKGFGNSNNTSNGPRSIAGIWGDWIYGSCDNGYYPTYTNIISGEQVVINNSRLFSNASTVKIREIANSLEEVGVLSPQNNICNNSHYLFKSNLNLMTGNITSTNGVNLGIIDDKIYSLSGNYNLRTVPNHPWFYTTTWTKAYSTPQSSYSASSDIYGINIYSSTANLGLIPMEPDYYFTLSDNTFKKYKFENMVVPVRNFLLRNQTNNGGIGEGALAERFYIKASNIPISNRFLRREGNFLPILNENSFNEEGIAEVENFIFSQTLESYDDDNSIKVGSTNMPNAYHLFDRTYSSDFTPNINGKSLNYNITIKFNRPIIVEKLYGMGVGGGDGSTVYYSSSDGENFIELAASEPNLIPVPVYSVTYGEEALRMKKTEKNMVNFLRIRFNTTGSTGTESDTLSTVLITNWLEEVE